MWKESAIVQNHLVPFFHSMTSFAYFFTEAHTCLLLLIVGARSKIHLDSSRIVTMVKGPSFGKVEIKEYVYVSQNLHVVGQNRPTVSCISDICLGQSQPIKVEVLLTD